VEHALQDRNGVSFDGNLDTLGWAVAVTASVIISASKTGVSGAGILAVAMFAQIIPARAATGVVLPLLIVADVIAVAIFRRHANWRELLRIFPWAALGVGLGTLLLGRIDDVLTKRVIGVILVLISVWQFVRQARGANDLPSSPIVAALTGTTAGITTMVANAAGPIMTLYLLAMRLPKLEFIGTGAWFFLLVNMFKVPFGVSLGIINGESLRLNLLLVPAVMLGAWLGLMLLQHINQVWFERIALAGALLGGLRLLFSP
jgi:uncharacterized membrane protein YfcA